MKTTILVEMHNAKRSHAVAFASVEILAQMSGIASSTRWRNISKLLSTNTEDERLTVYAA